MPPKAAKNEPPPPEPPQEIDPAVIAAREAMDRKHTDDRKAFERTELVARRRVEALEAISWKCVYAEREKRLNPAAWDKKVANTTPQHVTVKLLTGNRAIPQQTWMIPVSDDLTLLALKERIRARAGEVSATRSLRQWFSPEFQSLLLYGKEVGASEDETSTVATITPRQPPDQKTPRGAPAAAPAAAAPPPPAAAVDPATAPVKSLGVHNGCTLHLMLRTPNPDANMHPSIIR